MRSKLFEYKGKLYTAKQLAIISGISSKTILARIKRGLTIEKAMSFPLDLQNIPSHKSITDMQSKQMKIVFCYDNPSEVI